MFTFLLVLLIIVSVILIGAVLLQSGKGSGLAASFGGASSSSDIMGTHQMATGLSKGTWYLGGVFLFLAYVLAIMSARPAVPKSALDQLAQPPAAPVQQAPATQAPVLPLQTAPAPPAAPPTAPAKTPPR
jgi:preprotein translocase subunit SecG